MKLRFYHHLMMALVALVMLFVGCKKEETIDFEVPSDSILIEIGGYGREGTTTFTSENVSAVDVTSTPAGWEIVDIDMYSKSITVKAPSYEAVYPEDDEAADKAQMSGMVTLKVYTPSGKNLLVNIYVAILLNPDVNYVDTPANCYIANKYNTRYLFDPMVGGSSTKLETSYIEIIWQTSNDLIKYVDMQKDANGKMIASFYVDELVEDGEGQGKLNPGNALLGGYSASGALLWSWHVWVTNSDPENDTITLDGRTLMNINLGADCNSGGEIDTQNGVDNIIGRSYGMYYQWGRRTPIVGPNYWNFALNENKTLYDKDNLASIKVLYEESTSEIGTLDWALNNPLAVICGYKENGYDWLYVGHDKLWSDDSKSEHDPCPAGWRIPDSSIYRDLTIDAEDDAMDWKAAQGMYGWHLLDPTSGQKYFFTAQGRRNYLDGHLDIVNDDEECPIPWSGYYWTATTEGDRGVAMFFDLNSTTRTWNGFDASYSMQRANALPVRCVKE